MFNRLVALIILSTKQRSREFIQSIKTAVPHISNAVAGALSTVVQLEYQTVWDRYRSSVLRRRSNMLRYVTFGSFLEVLRYICLHSSL